MAARKRLPLDMSVSIRTGAAPRHRKENRSQVEMLPRVTVVWKFDFWISL